MTPRSGLEGVVRSWLRQEGHEDAERVLFTVLDQLDTTPQRHASWLARRIPIMNSTTTRLGLAGAALILLLFVGSRFVPGGGFGTADPTPRPTPQPSLRLLPAGSVDPGDYRVVNSSIPFAVTAPSGWTADDEFLGKGDPWAGSGVTLTWWNPTHIYRDACDWQGSLRAVESADDLASALADQAGHETSDPITTTLGGIPATRLDISLPAATDPGACDEGAMRLWPGPGPNEMAGIPIAPGQTMDLYIIDSDGQPLLVGAVRAAEASAADVAELEAIIASIRFQP